MLKNMNDKYRIAEEVNWGSNKVEFFPQYLSKEEKFRFFSKNEVIETWEYFGRRYVPNVSFETKKEAIDYINLHKTPRKIHNLNLN